MSERFAPVAVALSGVASRHLGWRPDEFWRATPVELATVLAPLVPEDAPGIDRALVERMMEQDHG
ncbi:phage tail assembly chaperone [uncultured Novosphingobium sp.]|uniref:phage tail assembly chaperone n=1 Tax=uncultured Novosphingobium sp. TaxID=292277 RepID=UPI0025832A1E|nr:phage tail assembly chaperone [uncultured Novosphingobium sp.]